jgi:hypothetical protein
MSWIVKQVWQHAARCDVKECMGKEFENGIVRRKYSDKLSCCPAVGHDPATFQMLKIWLCKIIILSLFMLL